MRNSAISLNVVNFRELPELDPGELPLGYFDFDAEKSEDGIPPVRDAEVEALENASSVPAPPKSPLVGKDGRKLTKKEVKEVRHFPRVTL